MYQCKMNELRYIFLQRALTKAVKRIKITVFNMSLGIFCLILTESTTKLLCVWKTPFNSSVVMAWTAVTVNGSHNGK